MTDDTAPIPIAPATLLGIVGSLGRIEGRLDGQTTAIKALATAVELNRGAWEAQGKAIAALPCHEHTRHISDLQHRMGVSEDTGKVHITEERTRRMLLGSMARVTVGVFSVLGVVATVLGAVWALK